MEKMQILTEPPTQQWNINLSTWSEFHIQETAKGTGGVGYFHSRKGHKKENGQFSQKPGFVGKERITTSFEWEANNNQNRRLEFNPRSHRTSASPVVYKG